MVHTLEISLDSGWSKLSFDAICVKKGVLVAFEFVRDTRSVKLLELDLCCVDNRRPLSL